jgi:hypothetical protein
MVDGPATRWAREQDADRPLRWKSLEIAAFSFQPKVVRALGPTREEKRAVQQHRFTWRDLVMLPLVLGAIAVFFYPAVAFVLLAQGGRFQVTPIPADVAVPLAGTILGVGGVIELVVAVRASRRGWSDQAARASHAVSLIFGTLAVVSLVARGSGDDVAGWPAWAAAGLLSVVAGAVGTRAARRSEDRRRPQAGPRLPARAKIAALPESLREGIRRDLSTALDVLESRGLVSAAEAERAREAELGLLSIAVSQPRP